MAQEFPYSDGDQPMFFHARHPVSVPLHRRRTTDNIKNQIIKEWEHGKKPEVPDYAYDLHTTKGRAMGRDEMHFLTEASRVIPELEDERAAHPSTVHRLLQA